MGGIGRHMTNGIPFAWSPPVLPDITPQDVSETHLAMLAERWITPEIAREAMLWSANPWAGAFLIGRSQGSYPGLAIPYFMPGHKQPVEVQLRLDNPPPEPDRATGKTKPQKKYLWAPGRRGRPYFEPGLDPALLRDAEIPIIITEGPLKALALHRLALYARREGEKPPFIVIAFIGVSSWRCKTGKTTAENGASVDVTGPLPELDLINWRGRKVIIAYDADVIHKPQVRAARWEFTKEAKRRNAVVGFLEWPIEKGKGIDDLLANSGPDEVLRLISEVNLDSRGWQATLIRSDAGAPRALLANALIALRSAPEC